MFFIRFGEGEIQLTCEPLLYVSVPRILFLPYQQEGLGS